MDKIKVLSVALILLALAFAGGRYSAIKPEEIKTSESQVETDKEKHKETTTVKVKHPDGTETSTTTIIEDSNSQARRSTESSSKSTPVVPSLNVSALGAYRDGDLSYGLGVSKQFVGPVTAGVFGLNNGTIGLSIGVNF